MLELFLV